MRRLLAGLLALALLAPVGADSRILVVFDRFWENDASTNYGHPEQQGRMIGAALDVLNKTGACYTAVPITSMKTEFARYGMLVHGWDGSTYTSADTFDAVMWLSWNGLAGSTALPKPYPVAYNGCYPCSLTMVAKKPFVPQLFLFGATNAQSTTTSLGSWGQSGGGLRCSTGVAKTGGAATGHSWGGLKGRESLGWLSASNQFYIGGPPAMIHNTTVPAGGVRTIMRVGPAATWIEANAGAVSHAANNADSLLKGSDVDTVMVWERPNLGTGGSPLIFANIMGASPCTDSLNSLSSIQNVPCEFDAPTFMIALAHLDSLTGGAVWCGDKPYGLDAAVVVSGAFSRSRRDTAGGGQDEDSTSIRSSLADDEFSSIPFTFAVNVDSLDSYPQDFGRLALVKKYRVTPQAWTGVVDSTAKSGATSSTTPVDVFGRFRTRAFYGDGSGVGADSSLHAGMVWQRNIVRNRFGTQRLSNFCVAPLDDYSPRNFLWGSGGADSLIYAIRQAGYTALRTDVHSRQAQPGKAVNRDRLIGWFTRQGDYRSAFDGSTLRVLGQTGGSVSGGKFSADTSGGSSGWALSQITFGNGGSTASVPHMIVGRWWYGLVHDQFTDYDWFPYDNVSNGQYGPGKTRSYEDVFEPFRHASTVNLYMSDFSGLTNGPPARPGFFALRSLKRQFDAINIKAGRTICRFVWPEEVR